MRILIFCLMVFSEVTIAKGTSHFFKTTAQSQTQDASVNLDWAKRMARTCGINPGCWALVAAAGYQAASEIKSALGNNKTRNEICGKNGCGKFDSGLIGLPESRGDYVENIGDTDGNTLSRSEFPYIDYDQGKKLGITKGAVDQINKAVRDTKRLINEAAAHGVTLDKATGNFKTPSGVISSKQLASVEGLAAAGLTPSQIAEVKEMTRQLEKQLQDKSQENLQEDTQIGHRTRGSGDNEAESGLNDYIKSMMDENSRKPAAVESLSGLSVLRNGEPVGIAQGNIFETVSQRYIILKQKGEIGF